MKEWNYITEKEFEDRVNRGIKHLNSIGAGSPGWLDKIDLDILDMSTYENSILGMVYGDYMTGLKAIAKNSPYRMWYYGFDLKGSELNLAKELDRIWTRRIKELRDE